VIPAAVGRDLILEHIAGYTLLRRPMAPDNDCDLDPERALTSTVLTLKQATQIATAHGRNKCTRRTMPAMLAGTSYVSTGHLPPPDLVTSLVAEVHARFGLNTEGRNADVSPALAIVPSDLFGVCVVGSQGSA
jgi:hypothetical protein